MEFLSKITGRPTEQPNAVERKPWNLLVVAVPSEVKKWYEVFAGLTMNSRPVKVYSTNWDNMNLCAYSSMGRLGSGEGVMVDLRGEDGRTLTFKPDFALIRELAKNVLPNQDYKSLLYGLKYANVPCVNSLEALLLFLERPWVHSELLKIRNRLGVEHFPLIDQTYYPNHRSMIIAPQFPVVVKLGHAEAGMGKMVVRNHHDMADFASVVALTSFYCTAEQFQEGEYDLRLQKIGPHYRAFKRVNVSGNWKTNTGSAMIDEIPVTDTYKRWMDECGTLFGGLHIFAVDVLHRADGQEFILEVNDSSIGFCDDSERDYQAVRELVLREMQRALVDSPAPGAS